MHSYIDILIHSHAGILGFEEHDLLYEESSQLLLVEVFLLELNVNLILCFYLFLCFPHFLEEGMIQCLLHRYSEVGVEHKHSVEQVSSFLASSWVESTQVSSALDGESFKIFESFLVSNVALVFF